jgi:hypothetical protein
MRRNYISPEFAYLDKNGTFSSNEIKMPFGSKMMEIDDIIKLEEDSIIWFENSNSEQLDFLSEQSLTPKSLDIIDLKRKSHTLEIDNTQRLDQRNANTKWVLKVNILNLLSEVIFSKLKNARAFEGITSSETQRNNINTFIRSYIFKNILSRYKFDSIDFWIRYNSLTNNQSLRYSNFFTPQVKLPSTKLNKISTNLENNILLVTFNQELLSTQYNFEYYFTINYSKI